MLTRQGAQCVDCGHSNLKRQNIKKKKKKREWKSAKLANQILTDHSSTSKNKKKKDAELVSFIYNL